MTTMEPLTRSPTYSLSHTQSLTHSLTLTLSHTHTTMWLHGASHVQVVTATSVVHVSQHNNQRDPTSVKSVQSLPKVS